MGEGYYQSCKLELETHNFMLIENEDEYMGVIALSLSVGAVVLSCELCGVLFSTFGVDCKG